MEDFTDMMIDVDMDVDDDLDDEFDKDDLNNEMRMIIDKKTIPVMSVFEKSKVISCRVHQINKGYKSNIPEIIEKEKITSSYDIAMKEFELNKLPPYILKRIYPDGRYEIWKHEDFLFFK